MSKQKSKAVFILWDEEVSDPKQIYVGGGYYDTIAVNKRIETRKVCYGKVTQANIEAAKQYATDDMADRVNVRVAVLIDDRK